MIIFPNCPKIIDHPNENDVPGLAKSKVKCEGTLVPLSNSTRVIAIWKCTVCGYEIK